MFSDISVLRAYFLILQSFGTYLTMNCYNKWFYKIFVFLYIFKKLKNTNNHIFLMHIRTFLNACISSTFKFRALPDKVLSKRGFKRAV